ncbi:MAG: SAM-dependent methyltransferase [Clostridia bacterium]|nr:SAM-dependent methyltransferase [Clostridia bacterium]MBQ2326179.1 SAM-dependent methyltransferase [Clostridia bacterium]MBQ5812638.1 SAM-dependent methyltransferase [Clostridia bacterium]
MKEECLICGALLEYLESDVIMECEICHKQEPSRTRCVEGHYVCSECHMKGVDSIIGTCMRETSKNPIEIIEKMMDMPFCHMHGPEHHIMIGSALLTAYKNAGGEIDLKKALIEMQSRGSKVPGGVCGMWGSCGAAVSSGIFVSIVTGATPLTNESWGLANGMTARILTKEAEIGGPRCCKRNSYISLMTAVEYVNEKMGVQMEIHKPVCSRFSQNNQCIGARCPFNPVNNK